MFIRKLPAPRSGASIGLGALAALVCAGVAAAAATASGIAGSAGVRSTDSLVGVRVVFENLAPENGTWLTPVWAGFHNGTFDFFDLGSPASTPLERLAEDGNTAPLATLFAGSGTGSINGVIPSDSGIPQIAPGGTATETFVVDSSDPNVRFFSYATQVIPSNDAFVGNDAPDAHRVFDNNGNFLGGYFTIPGSDVLDAGTEVNDEIPEHTAFFGQTEPNSGDDENGVVHVHPGYHPAGEGGILDDPMFANADFTAPGYEVARVTLYRSDTIVSGGDVSGAWSASGSPYILQGNVVVPAGQTLTVEPGVIVYAEEGFGLTIQGTLEALGTEDAPILFTGTQQASGHGGWTGIRFEYTSSTSRFEHCTIENGDRNSDYASGGGIHCLHGGLEFHHCTLRNNQAYVNGAALYAVGSSLLMDDCDVRGNLVSGTLSGEGGGIYCDSTDVTVTGCTIEDNDVRTSTYFGATNSRGGGLSLRECNGVLMRNIISGNYLNHSGTEAESSGGGVYINAYFTTLALRNNTIARNEVHYNNAHGGGVFIDGYNVEMINNAVFGNVGEGIYFAPGAETAGVSYSDIYGNTAGPLAGGYIPNGLGQIVQENNNGDPCDAYFNIFLDPLFLAPYSDDYHLTAGSPCIDAGDPASPFDPDGTIADIGALYYDQGTSGAPAPVAAGEPALLLLGSRPEPAAPGAEIRYRVPNRGPVRLTLYDLAGRAVRTLVDDREDAGVHQVTFDGRDAVGRELASGVYFYHLSVAGREASRRLTLLR